MLRWRIDSPGHRPLSQFGKDYLYVRPKPRGKSGFLSVGLPSWSLLRGQLRGSFPTGLLFPNKTSATPSPSVPGNHAATNASLESKLEPKINGRPERRTVATGTPAA